ncbi:hypothetical protein VC83_00404 [Pseudogymnoascus destructans]|uniref:Uncharacterized protein n=2 Tax=Pseudogymnoascus destructans TaxID=655981 RepID=L8FUM2_PSED2|nr:uncharacterized protein VC83_00404 [Pseudogymnoascus destructans]ELR03446.1 hypothetical protein GMDG_06179 [Pseudogymnoascus destructans 20631-21]OAF63453.2 hypothetical protein VC83_00404 [Pseudogymnoascus destructans]
MATTEHHYAHHARLPTTDDKPYFPHPAPPETPSPPQPPSPTMPSATTTTLLTTFLVPLAVAAALYLLLAFALIPLYQRHHARYASYLPLTALSTSTSTYRTRIQASIAEYMLPVGWRTGFDSQEYPADSRSGSEAGDEAGEELYEFVAGRRVGVSLDARRGGARRSVSPSSSPSQFTELTRTTQFSSSTTRNARLPAAPFGALSSKALATRPRFVQSPSVPSSEWRRCPLVKEVDLKNASPYRADIVTVQQMKQRQEAPTMRGIFAALNDTVEGAKKSAREVVKTAREMAGQQEALGKRTKAQLAKVKEYEKKRRAEEAAKERQFREWRKAQKEVERGSKGLPPLMGW